VPTGPPGPPRGAASVTGFMCGTWLSAWQP